MTSITVDMLCRCTGQSKRKKDETQEQLLRRENLEDCKNLRVLYLYDNLISRIENLHPLRSITHLYLQNNNITRIENLSSLVKLTKLYLSGNAITVVEGLEAAESLKELHIAYQRMPEGEKLLFEPRSVRALASSLEVLNVSGNRLESIEDLQCLSGINNFAATDNHFSHLKGITRVLKVWSKLSKLDLQGNPICRKHKYKAKVIAVCPFVGVLDGKEVSDIERQFLINWESIKKVHQSQRLIAHSSKHQTSPVHLLAPHLPFTMPPTIPPLPTRQPLKRRLLPGVTNPIPADFKLPHLHPSTNIC